MSAVLNFNQSLKTETCYKCGIVFAVPSYFKDMRLSDKQSFWCPNGHSQAYVESEADRLRKQLEKARADAEWQRGRVLAKEKELIAQKGLTTKAKKKLARVENGVCPECNRTFANVARHMQSKHGIECNQPPKGSKTR
jgi:hypothetical protein